eukprot:TRINITY_DN821_c0_g1_i1.p1 TRINITY_DN821_c0_g1~~TRINITY_DN821_c0_g1_i1.p1  ORF type:complete len:301 (-),score=100.18 TRINITY_DN821_c0_g1_i1:55-957(-)
MNQYPPQQGYVQAGSYPPYQQPGYPPQQPGYQQQGYSYDGQYMGQQQQMGGMGQQQMGMGMGQQMDMGMGQQQMGMGMGMGAASSWTQSYNNPSTAGVYRQFFDAGDFTRTGHLDQAGLRAALMQAGENEIDDETIPLMIMMFDVDGNGKIDFNEFNALMNYVNSTKQTYFTNAAANGGAGVTSRDIESMNYNTHSQFMNDVGGQDVMERGILPNINPTNKGFFTLGNVIKIAIIVGILHTLYQHNKLPFFNKNQQQVGYTTPQGGFNQYNNAGYAQGQQQGGHKQGGILGRIFGGLGRK